MSSYNETDNALKEVIDYNFGDVEYRLLSLTDMIEEAKNGCFEMIKKNYIPKQKIKDIISKYKTRGIMIGPLRGSQITSDEVDNIVTVNVISIFEDLLKEDE